MNTAVWVLAEVLAEVMMLVNTCDDSVFAA
jgi:hypothetical protein